MGMGSDCGPSMASGSAGGGAAETQGCDGGVVDNEEETQAEKRRSVFEAGCDCADWAARTTAS